MSSEKNCLWTFEKQTGRSEGPFDASGQNFKQRPYASLIREAIQNSMDAHLNDLESCPPVEISFSFGTIESNCFPNFFKLRKHIESCKMTYNNEDYSLFYDSMLRQFSDAYISSIPYLKISDRNTTGMKYIKNDVNNPFHAFVRSSQISVKNTVQGAAGSHGYGKAAYYQLSPLRTLLVSTMTQDKQCFFEGAAIIGTHLNNGEMLSPIGYYDNNGGEPSFFDANAGDMENNPIPSRFRRTEPGTDFYIMGFQPDNALDMCDEMIKESLRSYWLAILKEKIVIVIKPQNQSEILINKDRLDALMLMYFPESNDASKQLRTLNPRPYYDAYTKQHSADSHYEIFEKTLDSIGHVNLFVKKCKTNFDKIVYMRRPLMLVFATPLNEGYGFYGLFICDDESGDKLLRRLENSSHTEWKDANFKDASGKIYPEGKAALIEIKEFIDECIGKMFGRENQNFAEIAGLSDFLYVPDNLIEDDAFENHALGKPSGETTNEGLSIATAIADEEAKYHKNNKKQDEGSVIIESSGTILSSDKGTANKIVGTGHNNGANGNGENISGGDDFSNQNVEDSSKSHWEILNVPIRVFCKNEKGKNFHIVKIHCKESVPKAKLSLLVGLEEDGAESIPIVYSDKGMPSGNIINNLSLENGTNTIKILFADNLAHTVIKRVYYEAE